VAAVTADPANSLHIRRRIPDANPGIVGLGFNRGWFSFASDSAADKSNITLTVDEHKIHADRKEATQKVEAWDVRRKTRSRGRARRAHKARGNRAQSLDKGEGQRKIA
jgi:hypothetical protein